VMVLAGVKAWGFTQCDVEAQGSYASLGFPL
jgi:hypothetical protein